MFPGRGNNSRLAWVGVDESKPPGFLLERDSRDSTEFPLDSFRFQYDSLPDVLPPPFFGSEQSKLVHRPQTRLYAEKNTRSRLQTNLAVNPKKWTLLPFTEDIAFFYLKKVVSVSYDFLHGVSYSDYCARWTVHKVVVSRNDRSNSGYQNIWQIAYLLTWLVSVSEQILTAFFAFLPFDLGILGIRKNLNLPCVFETD